MVHTFHSVNLLRFIFSFHLTICSLYLKFFFINNLITLMRSTLQCIVSHILMMGREPTKGFTHKLCLLLWEYHTRKATETSLGVGVTVWSTRQGRFEASLYTLNSLLFHEDLRVGSSVLLSHAGYSFPPF